MLDARAFMISTLPLSGWLRRRRGTPTRAPAPASASRASSSLGLPAAPPAATHLLRAPSFRRPLSSRRGEAPWEREAAGCGGVSYRFGGDFLSDTYPVVS